MKRIVQRSRHLYEFCPGNCTRYYVMAVPISPDNATSFRLAFSWLKHADRAGPCILLDIRDTLYLGYFMEKMSMGKDRMHDAVALMCFLRERLGMDVEIPSYFEEYAWTHSGTHGLDGPYIDDFL